MTDFKRIPGQLLPRKISYSSQQLLWQAGIYKACCSIFNSIIPCSRYKITKTVQ